MLYISHLSYHTEREDGEAWHGYFTCVVEAPDVEAALDKTKALIHRLKVEEDVLDDVEAVFLESCVEVRSVPEEGFMAALQEWDGEPEGSVVGSIRGADDDAAVAYGSVAEDDEEETGLGERDGAEGGDDFDEPFVTF